MNLKKFSKEAKVPALVLAFVMFFNGWSNYDFPVLAADERTATVEGIERVDDGSGSSTVTNNIKADTAAFNVNPAKGNGNVTVSGNTLAEDVYTGTVTVTPTLAGVYTISETETGNYADFLTYNETTEKPAELYLKDSSGNISKVTFPSFTFDNVPPAISVTAPAEAWAKKKEIEVNADAVSYTHLTLPTIA